MNEENNTVNVLGNNEVSNKLDASENQKIETNINIIEDQNVNINIISQSDLSEKLSPSLSIIDRGQENEIASNVDYIGALQGFIVLILICMVAIGLSEIFKRN
jgi:hypothetical protein